MDNALNERDEADESQNRRLNYAFIASWIVNWFLLGAKIYVFVTTGSKAVLASMADSGGE